jgi:selenocysteine lyase/cysteine desulfurase
VVHGSKTGLILPSLDDLGLLAGDSIVAVDACQARITGDGIDAYLERGAIVFLTGSKFMGAPPFSGFALVPRSLRDAARPLPSGFATIFRRAEWPISWPGADRLAPGANPGLLLRLEAAIFELEAYQRLSAEEARRIISAFETAVRHHLVKALGVRAVAAYCDGIDAETHPIEMRTLVTLDLSNLNGGAWSFDDAQSWQASLLAHGVRLGQPVKCVKLADGRWGATLRIGLTMRQIVERAGMDQAVLQASFGCDMSRMARALEAVATRGMTVELPAASPAA